MLQKKHILVDKSDIFLHIGYKKRQD